jgi:amino-acid N-acetyltransferase
MANVIIREALLADTIEIYNLIQAHRDLLVPRSIANVVENVDRFVVALVDNKLVGCAAFQIHPEIGDAQAATVEIQSVAVEESHRKAGIGRAIVEEVMRRAALFGAREVLVLTFAPEFFTKLGFHETPKNQVMHKLYTGCINCTKHTNPFTCPEIAMKRELAK